jgi:hypothetical protein
MTPILDDFDNFIKIKSTFSFGDWLLMPGRPMVGSTGGFDRG